MSKSSGGKREPIFVSVCGSFGETPASQWLRFSRLRWALGLIQRSSGFWMRSCCGPRLTKIPRASVGYRAICSQSWSCLIERLALISPRRSVACPATLSLDIRKQAHEETPGARWSSLPWAGLVYLDSRLVHRTRHSPYEHHGIQTVAATQTVICPWSITNAFHASTYHASGKQPRKLFACQFPAAKRNFEAEFA